MKKIFMMAVAAAALTFASCGQKQQAPVDPNAEAIDYNLLKQIGDETGNHLSDFEIKYLLNKAGNGKVISLESFIDFMKK